MAIIGGTSDLISQLECGGGIEGGREKFEQPKNPP